MQYWEIVADKLSTAGWSWGYCRAVTPQGWRWIFEAHKVYGTCNGAVIFAPMTPRHLFFAGVPCTGKSLVGRWLADHKNYVHIDAEHEGGVHFDEAGVHGEWNKFLWDGRAREFVQALDKIGRPVVLNWGLPLWEHDYSFVVPALQNESVSAWWFRGNYERARAAFVAREKAKPENKRMSEDLFDKQLAQIKRHWMLIERIFAPQMVNGLMPDGSQRSAEDIWAEISKARDGDTND